MRRRNSLITIALLALVAVALPACKKEEPSAPPQAVKQKPPAPKPVQGQLSSSRSADSTEKKFDFSSKKDPFKAFVAAPKQQPKSVPIPGAVSGLPIQSYELSQFRVIGLIAGLKENKGMVVDPTGKAYVVREGMMIGKNNGKITKITAQYAEVVEQYLDDNGKIRKRVVRLTLPRKD